MPSCRPRCRSYFLAPTHGSVRPRNVEIGQSKDRAFRLRTALNNINTGSPACSLYLCCWSDCPPSLNLITRQLRWRAAAACAGGLGSGARERQNLRVAGADRACRSLRRHVLIGFRKGRRDVSGG